MGEVKVKAQSENGCATSEEQAVRDLWCAVIKQAVDSLNSEEIPGFFEDDKDKSKKRLNQFRAREIMHAKWFFSPNDGSALPWICEMLGLDIDLVRQRALSLIEKNGLNDYVARNVNVYTKMREKEFTSLQ